MSTSKSAASTDWAKLRASMVKTQIRDRGIHKAQVLAVMNQTPRERFLPTASVSLAYEDRAVPIGEGQTISQPYIVAYMTAHLDLQPDHRVLEIGTGSGYQTAILSQLCGHVYTVERLPELYERTARLHDELGYKNVTHVLGDGTMGLPEFAPYDRILVTAAAPDMPQTLIAQLAENGLLLIPLGDETQQTIIRVQRANLRIVEEPLLACRFVKLIGEQGWQAQQRD